MGTCEAVWVARFYLDTADFFFFNSFCFSCDWFVTQVHLYYNAQLSTYMIKAVLTVYISNVVSLKKKINWRIIALQYCIGFCHTSA